jgi:hypothetical protein
MPYRIKPYTKKRAKTLGVEVKPSRVKGKKIDVFKAGKKIASVGATGYNDYPTWMELEKKGKVEKGTANKRRRLYKIRHKNDKDRKGTPGYYADKLLW